MKKSKVKSKGWVEDEPEYNPEEEEIDLDLPNLPRLKNKRKIKKVKLDGDSKGNNLRNKVNSKGRLNIR